MVKIVLQEDVYVAKGESAKILSRILNMKEETVLFLTHESFYRAVPILIGEYNETIQEYTVVNNQEVKIREGSPGNWSEYLEQLVGNREIPRAGSVLLENSHTLSVKLVSVCTINKEAKMYLFEDNELFTNLAQTIYEQNIKEIVYVDDVFTKVFTALGVVHYKINSKKKPLTPTDLLEIHLNMNMRTYEMTEASLENTLRMDMRAADALLSGDIRIEQEINCTTPQGKRLLQMYIRSPSTDIQEIERRQKIVTELLSNTHSIRSAIKGIPDTFTICKKKSSTLSIHNILRIYMCLLSSEHVLSKISTIKSLHHEKNVLEDAIDYTKELVEEIESVIDMKTLDIKNTCTVKLSDLLDCLEEQKKEMYAEYAQETKDPYLQKTKPRLENNPVYGYCIRIPRTEENRLTTQLKLTVQKAGILFTTDRIKKINHRISEINNRIKTEHASILKSLTDSFRMYSGWIEVINHTVALIDLFSSLAEYAVSNSLVCPIFTRDSAYTVRNMCHPLLPTLYRRKAVQNISAQEPIKNTLEIADKKFCIITGPNMGGKTTFLKTVGIITILAQMGSYVPADYACLPIFKQVFVRIGASDNPDKGISTFMAEMIDVSTILNQVTDDSLIIIDELGRGTSDEDGYAIAASTVEYLARTNAMCLFATHFHELAKVPGVIAKRVGSVKKNNRLIMTYKIEDGVAESSHGINTARMMGFPEEVIIQAEQALYDDENTRTNR